MAILMISRCVDQIAAQKIMDINCQAGEINYVGLDCLAARVARDEVRSGGFCIGGCRFH